MWMKKIILLLLTLLLAAPHIGLSQQGTPPLTVYVATGDGRPKPGLTVTVQAENFRETSVTNASGYAVLRQLTPGTYEVIISLRNIELIRKTISYPETTSISETAPLSALTVKVSDLGNRPVPNIVVTLRSPTGIVSLSQRTNATGYASFIDVPFSQLTSVGGPYKLSVMKDGLRINEAEKIVEKNIESVEIGAKLVKVNITFTNIGGVRAAVDGTLTLSARNYTERAEVSRGTVSINQLVTSEVVGSYNASLSMKLGQREVVVHSSRLSIDSDAELVLQADVGELVVKVVDPAGQPVKGLGVLLGAPRYGNFSSGITDSEGKISSNVLPTSARIEQYQVSIFRGRTRILVEQVVLNEPKTTKQITLQLQRVQFNVYDYKGNPLSEALLQVKDPVTGRLYNATTVRGTASAEVFPGANEVKLIYKGRTIFTKVVELKGGEETFRINSVNFPVNIMVLDSLGRPVENLRAVVRSGGKVLLEGSTSSTPLKIELELPSEIIIDLYLGNDLLTRERKFAEGPSDVEIRFTQLIALGGVFLPSQILLTAALSVILAALVALSYFRLLKQH